MWAACETKNGSAQALPFFVSHALLTHMPMISGTTSMKIIE
jgi:hypothetical protein